MNGEQTQLEHKSTETDLTVNEYMRTHRGPRETDLVARIECRDGFQISVQGHRGAYSTPREYRAAFYSQVECGFPSAPVPELARWKDGDKDNRETDTEAVFGYVPTSAVADLLNQHGGIKGAASHG